MLRPPADSTHCPRPSKWPIGHLPIFLLPVVFFVLQPRLYLWCPLALSKAFLTAVSLQP